MRIAVLISLFSNFSLKQHRLYQFKNTAKLIAHSEAEGGWMPIHSKHRAELNFVGIVIDWDQLQTHI
jgi:hypothetical protein